MPDAACFVLQSVQGRTSNAVVVWFILLVSVRIYLVMLIYYACFLEFCLVYSDVSALTNLLLYSVCVRRVGYTRSISQDVQDGRGYSLTHAVILNTLVNVHS